MITSLFPILRKIVIYLALGVAVGLLTYKIRLNTEIVRWQSKLSPTPVWQESPVTLTDSEQATMSGDFTKEFETIREDEKISPKPNPEEL
jgi:hypothetical protein